MLHVPPSVQELSPAARAAPFASTPFAAGLPDYPQDSPLHRVQPKEVFLLQPPQLAHLDGHDDSPRPHRGVPPQRQPPAQLASSWQGSCPLPAPVLPMPGAPPPAHFCACHSHLAMQITFCSLAVRAANVAPAHNWPATTFTRRSLASIHVLQCRPLTFGNAYCKFIHPQCQVCERVAGGFAANRCIRCIPGYGVVNGKVRGSPGVGVAKQGWGPPRTLGGQPAPCRCAATLQACMLTAVPSPGSCSASRSLAQRRTFRPIARRHP